MPSPFPLTPQINQATVNIAGADAATFLDDLAAITPLPAGKATADITNFTVSRNPNGALVVIVRFK